MPDYSDRRLHPRRAYKIKVPYSVRIVDCCELKKITLYCETVNISAGGLCIETEYPIEPGHVLRFGNNINGIANWSSRFDNTYRIGIKFI